MSTFNFMNVQRCRRQNIAWQHLSPFICYNFVNPFSPVLLKSRNQSIDLHSKLLHWFVNNRRNGLKSFKLNSAKNVMWHMLFVCYLYAVLYFAKMSINSHDFFLFSYLKINDYRKCFLVKNPRAYFLFTSQC